MVDERTDAEGGDPVADLVERDHPAGDGRRHGGQRALAEADRQREQRGATQPGQPEDRDPEPRRVVGEGRGQRGTWRPARVAAGGSTTRAGSQRTMAANSTRPTVTMAQNAVSASAAWVVDAPSCEVISCCDQLPFMVSQIP